MLSSLRAITHKANLLPLSSHKNICYQLQKSPILFKRYFSETSSKDNELPDPHALVDDGTGKVRYNEDNEETNGGLPPGYELEITDEQFVEGMIVAMEEHCPDVKNITEDQKKDMVGFVERHKHIRLRP